MSTNMFFMNYASAVDLDTQEHIDDIFKEHLFDNIGEFVDFTTMVSENARVEPNLDYNGPDEHDGITNYKAVTIRDNDNNYRIIVYAYLSEEVSHLNYWSEVVLKTKGYSKVLSDKQSFALPEGRAFSFGENPNRNNQWLFQEATSGMSVAYRNGNYILVVVGEYNNKNSNNKTIVEAFLKNIKFIKTAKFTEMFTDKATFLFSSRDINLNLSKNWSYSHLEKKDLTYFGGKRGHPDNTNALVNIVFKSKNEKFYEERAVSYFKQFLKNMGVFGDNYTFEICDFDYLGLKNKLYSYRFYATAENGYKFVFYFSFFDKADIDISVLGMAMYYDNNSDFNIFTNFAAGISNYELVLNSIDKSLN